PAAAALCLLQLFVVTLLLYAAHRARAAAPVPVERRAPGARRIRRTDLPAVLAAGVALVLIAFPVLDLVTGSLRHDGNWSLANYRALDQVGQGSLVEASVIEALVNSLRTAFDATWLALLIGGLVS